MSLESKSQVQNGMKAGKVSKGKMIPPIFRMILF
jgi:hypothetical protein